MQRNAGALRVNFQTFYMGVRLALCGRLPPGAPGCRNDSTVVIPITSQLFHTFSPGKPESRNPDRCRSDLEVAKSLLCTIERGARHKVRGMSLIITSEPNRRGGGEQASHNSIEMIGQTFLIPLRRYSYCESIAVLLVGAGDASAGGIARGTAHGNACCLPWMW